MDDAWRDSIHRVNPYHFPLDWTANDWLRIILSFVVVLTAAHLLRAEAPVRRLLLTMSGVAAVGLAGGIAACFLPYALPLQGQPYRCLWPLELALYPLGFLTARRLWAARHLRARLAALALLAYLNDTAWNGPLPLLLLSCAAFIGVAVWRGMSAQPRVRDWPLRAAVCAVVLALPLWTAIKLGLVVALRQQLAALLDPVEMLQLVASLIDPLCWLLLVLLSAVLLARLGGAAWRFRLVCLSVCLSACMIFFALPTSSFYVQHWTIHGQDKQFLAEFLHRQHATEATPTVYWPCGRIDLTWIDLRVNNYFEWPHQIAGNLFSEGTAREGARRTRLARKFELERWRKEKLLHPPERMSRILNVYQARGNESPPELADFLRLCQEAQLDFAVLPQRFEGLYTTANESLFIYDCRALRARLKQTPARGMALLPPNSPLSSN